MPAGPRQGARPLPPAGPPGHPLGPVQRRPAPPPAYAPPMGSYPGAVPAMNGWGSAAVARRRSQGSDTLWLLGWLGVSIPVRGVQLLYGTAALLGLLLVGGFSVLVVLLVRGEERASRIIHNEDVTKFILAAQR